MILLALIVLVIITYVPGKALFLCNNKMWLIAQPVSGSPKMYKHMLKNRKKQFDIMNGVVSEKDDKKKKKWRTV